MITRPEGERVDNIGARRAPTIVIPGRRPAEKLRADSPRDIDRGIQIVTNGGIIICAFNGVYGIFADADNPKAAELIHQAKDRPLDRKLILVYLPEHISEVADLDKSRINGENFVSLSRDILALGSILHVKPDAPSHLIQYKNNGLATILDIYTNYDPINRILDGVRNLGLRGLVGTSANKRGEPTHWKFEPLYQELGYDVDAAIIATPCPDFSNLDIPDLRRRSTTVVDFTGKSPRLHRDGNVTAEEMNQALLKWHFPQLVVGEDVVRVKARVYSGTPPPIAA